MPTSTSSILMTNAFRNGLLNNFIKLLQPQFSSFSFSDPPSFPSKPLTTTSPLSPSSSSSSSIEKINNKNDPKLIIIGAGLSGLSAAEHLIKNGFNNIEILEASNRFGGRIYTRYFGDAICELGAKCITKRNSSKSIYDLIKNNIDYEELKKFDQISFLTSNGKKLNPNIVNKATILFDKLIQNSSYLKNTILIDRFNNSKIYLESETDKLAKTLFKKDSEEASKIFNTLINDYCSFFGCDLSKIHVYQLSKTSPFYNNRIIINNGMNQIIKTLIDNINKENLLIYSKPVNIIKWSKLEPFKKIQIKCLDNTKYYADHVLCTLPLGILKTFHQLLFKPSISIEKISAINNLGTTSPGQFYLKYKDNIYNWFSGNSIKPAWSSIDLNNRTNLDKDIIEISTISNSKHVLEFKRIGDEDFERINEIKIIKSTTELLRKLLNNSNIPYPIDIIRSNWGTDTKYLGGLPVLMKSNSEKFVDNLSNPCYSYKIDDNLTIPKILFAGDATDWDGFGTLDGARQSGIREAQRILDFYKYKSSN